MQLTKPVTPDVIFKVKFVIAVDHGDRTLTSATSRISANGYSNNGGFTFTTGTYGVTMTDAKGHKSLIPWPNVVTVEYE